MDLSAIYPVLYMHTSFAWASGKTLYRYNLQWCRIANHQANRAMSDAPSHLFSPSLISASVHADLPDGFAIRPLATDDYAKGFYECLGALTWVGVGDRPRPTEPEFRRRFDEMAAAAGTYFFAVVEHRGRVVGTGCLVVERKLYGCSFLPFCSPVVYLSLYRTFLLKNSCCFVFFFSFSLFLIPLYL